MFNKKAKPDTILAEKKYSVLSEGVTVTGEVKIKDDLRVDGNVEGNISCEGKVIIGPNGCVSGNIESKSIELMGKVNGNILVHDIIVLKSSSYYDGDITALNIEIEAGANFFGNCKMINNRKSEKDMMIVEDNSLYN
ncbi:polymer-forming cytoskeletal protein [Dysgonomonas sp. ZJ279]|uniref:bactofilin family protein n=1 Tax=Dysgonomonas sp. ZJ279 TaxID=2709796 RepID=UPI0013EBE0F2|nr:polymer-forming cytoskeletal protein [Dysgonomonas sp. ZJ279]